MTKKVAEGHTYYTTGGKQPALFPHLTDANGNGHAVFRDPAFGENKSLPVHRWIPWIAGYSASFVDDVMSAYLPQRRGALILDPFCGVGTTLLEAILRGHKAVGFEINPYAALATRAKLNAFEIDLRELDGTLAAAESSASKWKTTALPKSIAPPPLKSRIAFFSTGVQRQVLHALGFINGLNSQAIADLYRAAFGATMVSFSNYSYEPSLGSRPAAGKPLVEHANVGRVLLTRLRQMRADIAWLQEEIKEMEIGKGWVINADFFAASGELEDGSVNLMITSPPYMNNYHYVRNTRPQLYWLKFISSPSEQRDLELNNFGRYWQTVRDSEPIALTFHHAGLEKILEHLRATRMEKGAYGGPGWANYVATYFNDCSRFMAVLRRVLARGGVGVVVIGNSIIQGIDIRTERILAEIAIMHGLRLDGVYCLREKRVGASITQSSVRHGNGNKTILSEFAVALHKG